jgi:hypothetical protein
MNNMPQHNTSSPVSAKAKFGSETCWNCGKQQVTQQTEFLESLGAYGWGVRSRVLKSFAKIPTCDVCTPKVAQASKIGTRYRGRGIMPTMAVIILLCIMFTIAVPFITIPVGILAGVIMFSVYRTDKAVYRPYHERLLGDNWEPPPAEELEEPVEIPFAERWWRVGVIIVAAIIIIGAGNTLPGSIVSIITFVIAGLLLASVGVSHFLKRHWGRGILGLIAGVDWILAGVFSASDTMLFFLLGVVLALAVMIWSVVDAIRGKGV